MAEEVTSWAVLWDQTDAVANHTQKGIEFLERFAAYAKDRALIEDEYATKLKALTKKSLGKKKEDEDARAFSYIRSFTGLLRETDSLAAQHEMIAERIRKDVIPFVNTKSSSHKQSRKQYLGDLQQIHHNLNATIEVMFKQQKSYGKAFKEAEAAYLKYYKAEKNMEISRLDLEKARNNAEMRNQMSEEAKQVYAAALGTANDAQNKHYTQLLPSVLERLRNLDEERIRDTQQAMEMTIHAETEVAHIIARCHEDMKASVAQIDASKDTALVVESFRTGYVHPQAFPFEDLGNPKAILSAGPNGEPADLTLKRGILNSGGRKDAKAVARKQSMHQKLFGSSDKHKGESDYGNLPPQQRVRRLQKKIEELEKSVEKNSQAHEGLQKMKTVYRENPKLGNASDCEQQLQHYVKEVDGLNRQIANLKVLLDAAQSEMHHPVGGSVAGSDTPPSIRSDSGSGHFAPPRPQPPHSQASQRTSYSEESVSSEGSRGHTNGNVPNATDEAYEEFDAPRILGTCVTQYAYDGMTDGTLRIEAGEELLLIEKDMGDGWTRVRRPDTQLDGFAPTTYLQCKWYSDNE